MKWLLRFVAWSVFVSAPFFLQVNSFSLLVFVSLAGILAALIVIPDDEIALL